MRFRRTYRRPALHSSDFCTCCGASAVSAPQLLHWFTYRVENENSGRKNRVNRCDRLMTFCGAFMWQYPHTNETTLMMVSRIPVPNMRSKALPFVW